MSAPLLELSDVEVEFRTRDGIARVLNRVGFSLSSGSTLGIVGESGCGKSMTALTIMRLVPQPPGRIAGGIIRLDGENLLTATEARMREIRGNEVSMVFQEPMTSLNPVFSVGNQIAETVRLHQGLSKREALDRAVEMLAAVGIPVPERRIAEYPHQLSGGMRQRVMIAIGLACGPRVLIADEPTTALDVTVQAQIFDLLIDLKERTGTSIILITHDMGAIAEMAERVVVMYAGRIVEEGPVEVILGDPLHPYTRGLITCVPHLEEQPSPERRPLTEIAGMVPALTALGRGCAFAPRCNHATALCREQAPPLEGGDEHRVACWLHER
ncbi:MAG: ABC transporter ATP-binding protein [Thiotrichales bacterium]|nr:ABC transporter ATP-binding protein [Thiotrichales bacterium]